MHLIRPGFIILLSLFLFACGGGGSSSPTTPETPPAPPASDAELGIDITGLPSGETGSVTVTGPDGYSETITQSTSLTGLSAGTYTITASDVDADGVVFDVIPGEQTVTLAGSESEAVSLIYQSNIVSEGVISNFGSIYVNGIRFDTSEATVTMDETPNADESDLGIGMVVTVQGRATADGETANAHSVSYDVNAKGPVDQVSLSQSTITVLGQVFQVDELTLFEDVTFETLAVGDVVEISAIVEGEDTLLATRVELEEGSSAEYKAKGEISNLNTELMTFDLDNVGVDYSAATVNGELADGSTALVITSQALQAGVIIADTVKVRQDDDDNNGQQVALDGVITEMLPDQQFIVAGQTIAWSDDTEFFGGDSDDLAVGLRIKAFGPLVDDVLQSRKIRLDKPGIIKVEGHIDAVDTENNLVTVLNTTFSLDSHSRFVDRSDARQRRMTLADLVIGDLVEIKAFQYESALIIRLLKRLDTEEEDGEISLSGRVGQITPPSMKLQGVTIVTNDVTEFELDGDEVDLDTFFSVLASGDEVDVSGQRQSDGSLLATEVELVVDDDGNKGRSGRVKFEGVISEIVSDTEFVVNERRILTNARTEYKHGDIGDLMEGVLVEIKGRESDDGTISAEKIEFERDDNKEEVKLTGVIDTFNSDTDFTVNGQAVTTTEQTEYKNGNAEQLGVDVSVEIEGYLNGQAVLVAEEIEFDDADEMEIKGTITNFVSDTDFYVGEQAVTTTEDTGFKNGNRSLLEDGIDVEVEGYLTEDNILIAKKIAFEEREESEVKGTIQSVIDDTTFVVSDVTVLHDEFTAFKGGNAEDIDVGRNVEVEGYLNADDTLVAAKIDFEDDDDNEQEISVEGVIESFVSATDFIVDGQNVTTNGGTRYDGGTAEDLADGVEVEIEGVLTGNGVLIAKKVAFE